jgi:hypothetical protein
MVVVTFVIAVLLVFAGVAGVAYSVVRGAGYTHWPAAVTAYVTIPATFAGLLLLLAQPELATAMGYLCGAIGLSGCAWWLWQRRPSVEAGQLQDSASSVVSHDERTAKLRAGMTRKVEWTVEEL